MLGEVVRQADLIVKALKFCAYPLSTALLALLGFWTVLSTWCGP